VYGLDVLVLAVALEISCEATDPISCSRAVGSTAKRANNPCFADLKGELADKGYFVLRQLITSSAGRAPAN